MPCHRTPTPLSHSWNQTTSRSGLIRRRPAFVPPDLWIANVTPRETPTQTQAARHTSSPSSTPSAAQARRSALVRTGDQDTSGRKQSRERQHNTQRKGSPTHKPSCPPQKKSRPEGRLRFVTTAVAQLILRALRAGHLLLILGARSANVKQQFRADRSG